MAPDPTPLSLLRDAVHQMRDDSNRRSDELRTDLNTKFAELNEKVDRVEAHTVATNGRVGRLELARARVEGTKAAYGWLLPMLTSLCSGGAVSFIVLLVTHNL